MPGGPRPFPEPQQRPWGLGTRHVRQRVGHCGDLPGIPAQDLHGRAHAACDLGQALRNEIRTHVEVNKQEVGAGC